MYPTKYKLIMLSILCVLLLWVIPISAQTESIRMAVIDIGGTDSVPSALMDILLIELSNDPNITLLEREKIKQILSEQKISLSLTEKLTSNDIVKTGQILAADSILMLQNETKEENNYLRLRLVETRNGMKLIDSNLSMKINSSELMEKAKLIAQSTIQHIHQMNINPDQTLLVGVSVFKSEELAERWNWLSDVIPTNIEQNLVLYSGVRLMERTEVKSLLNERELSDQLPESISASAILLTGSYSINREKETISILVRARKNNQNIFEASIEGPLNETERVCDELVQKIIEKASSGISGKIMDPAIEAKMLEEEAKTYINRQEFERALYPAQSAYALMPQSPEYMELIIQSLMGGELSPQEMGGEEQLSLINPRLRVINLAEHIVRKCPLPKDENLRRNDPQDIDYLNMHSYALEKSFTAVLYGTSKFRKESRFKDIFSELEQSAWSLLDICNERYTNQSKRLYELLLYHASSSVLLMSDIDSAIKMTKSIIEKQIKSTDKFEFPGYFFVLNEFYSALVSNFSNDRESIIKGENFLLSLCKSPQDYLSLQAYRFIIMFYSDISPDYEKLRNVSREYTDLCKSAGYPDPSPISNILSNITYYENKQDSEKYESELLEEIIDFSFRNRLVKINTPFWTLGTIRLSDLLEKQGRYADSINYLNKLLDIIPKDGEWHSIRLKISEIQAKHPETKIHESLTASEELKSNPEIILSDSDKILIKDELKNLTFRRLAIVEKEIVIVFSENLNNYGIIKLDRKSKEVKPIQSLEAIKWYDTDSSSNRSEYNKGPSVALNNGNVYLGFMHDGFLIFNKDGSTKRINEDNGLVYNKIRHLESLGDKIYAIVGESRKESGIMEFDVKTGASKIITSTRMDTPKCELDNTEIKGMVADPERNVLWVLSSNLSYAGEQFRKLYSYNPNNGKFNRVKATDLEGFLSDTSNNDNINGLQIFGDSLVIYNGRGLCQLGLNNLDASILVHNYLKAKWDLPWYFYPDSSFTPVKNGLVCASYNQLLYFQNGKEDSDNISKSLFKESNPDKLEIREIVPTEDGFYILTPNNLYFFNIKKN
jgi:tetratricopeptide (TPR) repeat protein